MDRLRMKCVYLCRLYIIIKFSRECLNKKSHLNANMVTDVFVNMYACLARAGRRLFFVPCAVAMPPSYSRPALWVQNGTCVDGTIYYIP